MQQYDLYATTVCTSKSNPEQILTNIPWLTMFGCCSNSGSILSPMLLSLSLPSSPVVAETLRLTEPTAQGVLLKPLRVLKWVPVSVLPVQHAAGALDHTIVTNTIWGGKCLDHAIVASTIWGEKHILMKPATNKSWGEQHATMPQQKKKCNRALWQVSPKNSNIAHIQKYKKLE